MLYGFEEDLGIYVAPKHRRSKDNPYTLSQRGGKYWISFRDGSNKLVEKEIDDMLFRFFVAWELDDLSELNEDLNHRDSSPPENSEPARVDGRALSPVEMLMAKEEVQMLYRGIALLPEEQRRRLIMYYFHNKTYKQIAESEGCTIMPVKRSIDRAIEKLQKYFIEQGLIPPDKLGK